MVYLPASFSPSPCGLWQPPSGSMSDSNAGATVGSAAGAGLGVDGSVSALLGTGDLGEVGSWAELSAVEDGGALGQVSLLSPPRRSQESLLTALRMNGSSRAALAAASTTTSPLRHTYTARDSPGPEAEAGAGVGAGLRSTPSFRRSVSPVFDGHGQRGAAGESTPGTGAGAEDEGVLSPGGESGSVWAGALAVTSLHKSLALAKRRRNECEERVEELTAENTGLRVELDESSVRHRVCRDLARRCIHG